MRPAHQDIGLTIAVEKGVTGLTGLGWITVSPYMITGSAACS